MQLNESILTRSQKIVFSLLDLYQKAGYLPYRMSKFEEYDLYAEHKDFLTSQNVITFTDMDGSLMALKPDVTLSVIKHSKDTPAQTQRLFYSENVYRDYKELLQAGLECFGKVGFEEIIEVIELALSSLNSVSNDCALEMSCPDIIDELIGAEVTDRAAIFKAIGEKNTGAIKALGGSDTLAALVAEHGTINDILPRLDNLLSGSKYAEFRALLTALNKYSNIIVDFSLTADISYYNSVIFKGFINGIPTPVLSGGRYDKLLRRMGRVSNAIGFAVYTDALEREAVEKYSDEYLNIALPKGRLGEKVYNMFAEAGYECPELLEKSRKLVFENAIKKVRYFWVKPSDVAVYVERGAADIGVVGKDILNEGNPDVYELLNLNTGLCRMCVAAPKDFKEDFSAPLRVATTFPTAAKKHYAAKGRDIDIINLHGSVEIAPLLGISDVIVDIVETGTTLKENNLEVIEEIFPISARLISNKSAFKFKSSAIDAVLECMRKQVKYD